jgi:hypothetical protein
LKKSLDWKVDQDDLLIILTIFQDIIRLKFGRRVSNFGIVTMAECFNTLLAGSQLSKTKALPNELKIKLASTVALLYYFKHDQVLGLFLKSQMDLD